MEDLKWKKAELRRTALYSAEKINPSTYMSASMAGQSGLKQTASIEKVLKDADTIYAWLSKDL